MERVTKKRFRIQTKAGFYWVVIWWDKWDKAYLVKVPSLPGVVTFGKTLTEAKRMAQDAIELYCDCIVEEEKIVVDDAGKVFGKVPKERVIALAR